MIGCTLPGKDPKRSNVNPDPNVDPGDDHHSDNITKFSWHHLISNPYLKKLIKK